MWENLFKPMHLLVIFIIIVLIYGPRKLGDLGKGLGEGIRNFKASMNEGASAKTDSTATTTTTASNTTASPEEKK
jgi:sec-independent protein translocase protein TatA